jgi:hypothetical protein
MKQYGFRFVVFGLTAALVALLWTNSSSRIHGMVDNKELMAVPTVASLPIRANHLVLIEFFAGY